MSIDFLSVEALIRAPQASTDPPVMIALGVVIISITIGIIAAAVRYPLLGMAMILTSVAVSGYAVEVGPDDIRVAAFATDPESMTLRAEYVFVPLGAFSIVLGRLLRRQPVKFGRSVWLAAWIGANLTSSMLSSPTLGYSLRMTYFYLVGALAYLGIHNYVTHPSRLRSVLTLSAGLVASQVVIALFLGGRWLDFGVVRLHGTFREPVIFSSYMVAMSLLLLGWGVGPSTSTATPVWILPVAVAGLLTSALAMSRASWVMAALGVAVILFFDWRWRTKRPLQLLARVAAGGVLAVAVMSSWIRFAPGLYSSYNDPFPEFETSDRQPEDLLRARLESNTWLWRLDIAREVLRVVRENPLLGNGTLTFGQTHDVFAASSEEPSDGWIPSGSLLVLHDTGVIGLVLFGGFLLAVFYDALWAMRSTDVQGKLLCLGGLAGMIAWIAMEQMSTNMILGIGWVFLGIVSAIASVARSSSLPAPDTSTG